MSGIVIAPGETNIFRIVAAVIQLQRGRSNATGSVTLRANQTTTTVSAPSCAPGSQVFLFARTANAGNVVASTFVLAANVTTGQFIVTHPSDANTDKTFSWAALG